MTAGGHIAELSNGIVELSRQIIEKKQTAAENCRINT